MHGSSAARRRAAVAGWSAAKLAVSVSLLAWLLSGQDFGAAMVRLSGANVRVLALAGVLELVLVAIVSVRWSIVFRAFDRRLKLADAFRLVLIGTFFNQALLATLGGDAMRVWLAHRSGMELSFVLTTVVIDRLTGVVALAALILASVPVLLGILDPAAGRALVVATGVIVLAFGAFIAAGCMSASLGHWPLISKGLAWAKAGYRFARRPKLSLAALILSLLVHASTGIVIFAIASATQVDIRLDHAILLAPPVMLVAMLPISLAGWGVREAAMVVAFSSVGVPAGDAMLVSLMFGLVALLTSLPGAAIWIAHSARARA